MENHLVKYIEIKNFKCFDDFKAEGFKRVNLISGKNNVGKTALMEGCYINLCSVDVEHFASALFHIRFMRENLSILNDNLKFSDYFAKNFIFSIEKNSNISTKTNFCFSSYKLEEKHGQKKYNFIVGESQVNINFNDFSVNIKELENLGFIDVFGLTSGEITRNYAFLQKKDEEKSLDLFINEFDERIKSFKIINDKPQCKINDKYLDITELGDGLKHLIYIVTSLFKTENGYLFIDEIGSGVHYTQLDRLWEIVLTLAKENNVQVFATTHSKECIEAYHRAAKKLEEHDIAFIRLNRLKSGEIKASVFDYEMFANSMEQDHEVRGW